jgi:PhnB protein
MQSGQDDMPRTAIEPWLSVRRGPELVRFYTAAFGAVELHRVANEAGEIVCRLEVDGARFWVSDEPDASPEALGRGSARMILAVADPDALFDRAVAAGATVIAPMYEDHGWRIGRIADPAGHHWEIARQLHAPR